MKIEPLKQFTISEIIHVKLAGYNISYTNSALAISIVLALIILFFTLSLKNKNIIPTRLQMAAEIIYEMILAMVNDTAGIEAKKYMPFIFSLFIFILFCNLWGMIPHTFAVTSHIAITFGMAAFIFIAVTVIGFIRHGTNYLKLFLPDGVPVIMSPLLVVIELFAYLSRPVSLSIRLAANVVAGHIVMKVLASFTIMAGFFGIFPLGLLALLTGFEIFVAILQAYIFSILTCVYLNDALNLH